MYNPDRWSIVKIQASPTDTFYKVFGSWSGGYLDGDSWRMNSGIENVTIDDDYFLFEGESGSVYKCHKDAYGTNSYGAGVLHSLITKFPDQITLVQEDDWKDELQIK